MQKSLIKQRFSKCIKTYETSAIVQKNMAKELADLLDNKNYKNILELGCGTGFLTSEIIKKIKPETYDAVDIVDNCKPYIKKIWDKINFMSEDIENFKTDKKYDLIVSNASLQWVEDLPAFTKNLKNNLKNEGHFLFTLFGKENFKEMKNFIKNPLKYYTVEELTNIFSEFSLMNIYDKKEVLEFETPKEVLLHIKNTGVNALSDTRWGKSDLNNFEKTYPVNQNGKYNLTYHPVFISLEV